MIYNSIREKLTKIFPYFFAFVLFTSGFYSLPFLYLDPNFFLLVKRAFLLALMVVMSVLIDWGRIKFDFLSKCCLVWGILHIIFLLIKMEFFELYFLRIAQILFIWILIKFLVQRSDSICFAGLVQWFPKVIISGLALILLLLSWNFEVAIAIAGGFGNNRVNFSIWLFQFVFLIYFFTILKDRIISRYSFLRDLSFCSPIIILQSFSGGRTGLVASVLLIIFVAIKAVGFRFGVLVLTYLCALITVSSWVSPISNIHFGTDVLRNVVQIKPNYESMDRLTSSRLTIASNALDDISLRSLFYGNGLNNFKGTALGQSFQVHNIYLRALGEFGLLGFFSLVLILLLPYRTYGATAKKQLAQFFCGIYLLIGFSHPEILVTAINTCLVYWVAFAYLISPVNNRDTLC